LAYGDTGPDLQPLRDISYEVYGEEYWVHHLPVQTLVIACGRLSIPGSCFPQLCQLPLN
jgi:hypothetical protein